jgi:flagellar biosynthesis protein FliQ
VLSSKGKIVSAIWGPLVVIGTIVGIIAAIPVAIANVKEWGPDWVAHPNTWWIFGGVVIFAAGQWVIWRKFPDETLEDVDELLKKEAPLEYTLLINLKSISDQANYLQEMEGHKIAMTHIIARLENDLPVLIKQLYGPEVEGDYDFQISSAKKRLSTSANEMHNAWDLYNVAHSFVYGLIIKKTSERPKTNWQHQLLQHLQASG